MKRCIKPSTPINVHTIVDHEFKGALKDCVYRVHDQLVKEFEESDGPHPGDLGYFLWDVIHEPRVEALREDLTSAVEQAVDKIMKMKGVESR